MTHTVAVSRMIMVNKKTYVWLPLMILGIAWAASLAVLGIIDANIPGRSVSLVSSGAQAPIWYFAVVGVQSMTFTFPFSQALSVSRRAYFAGTLLTAAAATAGLSAIITLGAMFERATDGWGRGWSVFLLGWLGGDSWPGYFLFVFALTMTAFLIGFVFATIYKRAGMTAVTLSVGGIAFALVGLAGLVTWRDAWGSVGSWFAALTPATGGLWLLALGTVVAAAGAAILRRTIP